MQGRSGQTLLLRGADDRNVPILPLAVQTVIEEGAQVTQFQLLCTGAHTLELRFEPAVLDAQRAFARAHAALSAYLRTLGLDGVRIVHGRKPPVRDRPSGKLTRVRNAPRDGR